MELPLTVAHSVPGAAHTVFHRPSYDSEAMLLKG